MESQSINRLIGIVDSNQQILEEDTSSAIRGMSSIAGKTLSKALPGAGLAYGAYDTYDRAKKGDYTGAAMSAASGLASLVPGVGTAASLGISAAQAARDYSMDNTARKSKPTDVQQTPPLTDKTSVTALQRKLVAAGARIAVDGVMGPATRAAIKQFPQVLPNSIYKQGSLMSESEKISALRAKLAAIENKYTLSEANPVGAVKGGVALVKGAAQRAKDLIGKGAEIRGGKAMEVPRAQLPSPKPTSSNLPATPASTKPATTSTSSNLPATQPTSVVTGQPKNMGTVTDVTPRAVPPKISTTTAPPVTPKVAPKPAGKGGNIAKTVAATAAGAGLGYLTSKGADYIAGQVKVPRASSATTPAPSSTTQSGASGKRSATASTSKAPCPAVSPKVMRELDTLARSFGDSNDPEVQSLMQQYSDLQNRLRK